MKKNIIQKKSPQNYHGPWKPNLIKFFYSKRKKTQNYLGPWVPNLILSYQALYITKYGFFWIASKNFSSWDHYISGEELIEKVEEIEKNIRTWGCGTSHFRDMALWRRWGEVERGEGGSQISIFYSTNIWPKTFIPYCSHEWLKTFPHSCALLRCLVFYKNAFLLN